MFSCTLLITPQGSALYRMDSIGVTAYTDTMTTLADRVKALRIEKGWTQSELARRAGLNGQTVHRIEHGTGKGGWKSRSKIARALGISVASLDAEFTPSQEPTDHAPTARASIALASLSEQQLIEGIFAFTKELERRQKGGDGPNPPSPPEAPHKPTPHPRRHR